MFHSEATNLVAGYTDAVNNIFFYDKIDGTLERVSESSSGTQANAASVSPRISDHDYYVVYESTATNLVASDSNSTSDIFIKDMRDRSNQIITRSSEGIFGNVYSSHSSLSPDGSVVTYTSEANNLVRSH